MNALHPATNQVEHVNETIDICESLGIAVFPGNFGEKETQVKGWPRMPIAEALALSRATARARNGRINLAARTGPAADGFCYAVIDIDAQEQAPIASQVITAFGESVVFVVRTGRGFHYWLRLQDPVYTGAGGFGDVLCISKTTGVGHLANLPPSKHPSGVLYAWEVRNG